MNNYPRSQFQRQTYYGAGNIMPFHAGYGSNHGTFTRASMPQSFFGRPANGVVNGYNFQQPSKQVRNAVQRYLDINCTDNCNRNAGNPELVGYLYLMPWHPWHYHNDNKAEKKYPIFG